MLRVETKMGSVFEVDLERGRAWNGYEWFKIDNDDVVLGEGLQASNSVTSPVVRIEVA